MKTELLLLAAALTTGCYSDTVVLNVSDARADGSGALTLESEQAIDDAEEILGYQIELSDKRNGSIHVEFVDTDDGKRGLYSDYKVYGPLCPIKSIRSTRDGLMLAHEIGHALGLPHADSQDNIMCEDMGCMGIDITANQDDTMIDGMRGLERCRDLLPK